MADVAVPWNTDFLADATGDLLVIDGDDEVRLRLERRLFTAVQGYVWHPEYGAGLPQKIGSTYSVPQIRSIVMSQINLEATVAPNPAPIVTVSNPPNNLNSIVIGIQYYDAVAGVTVSFSITT